MSGRTETANSQPQEVFVDRRVVFGAAMLTIATWWLARTE
jgi:hypothetical protein